MPKYPEESIEELIAEHKRRKAFIAELKKTPRPLQFPMSYDENSRVLISKDASRPGKWRVTRFALEYGEWVPTGHTDADDFASAVDSAANWSDLGYKPPKRHRSNEPHGRRL